MKYVTCVKHQKTKNNLYTEYRSSFIFISFYECFLYCGKRVQMALRLPTPLRRIFPAKSNNLTNCHVNLTLLIVRSRSLKFLVSQSQFHKQGSKYSTCSFKFNMRMSSYFVSNSWKNYVSTFKFTT